LFEAPGVDAILIGMMKMRHIRRVQRRILAGILLVLAGLGVCTTNAASVAQWEGIERVVAFGDVHGDFQALIRLLTSANVIDDELNWSAGRTHLVSLGDLLDRGADSRQVMDLLITLQSQAEDAGGRVHVVLGNHELMNLTGDLRYVAPGEWLAFSDEETPEMRQTAFDVFAQNHPELSAEDALDQFNRNFPAGFFAHRQAFSRHGYYGSWLLNQPPLIRINRTLYVHGGVSSVIADYQPDDLASTFEGHLRAILTHREALVQSGLVRPMDDLLDLRMRPDVDAQADFMALINDPLFLDNGPLWYRGNSLCHPLLETAPLETQLARLHADRVVVGHSPTPNRQVTSRLDGRVIKADTGMLASYYNGKGYALITMDGKDTILSETGEVVEMVIEGPQVNPGNLSDATLEGLLQSGELAHNADELTTTGEAGTIKVAFEKMSRRKSDNLIASYRFDRLLGMNLVPVSVVREVNGAEGVLTPYHHSWITHTTLAEQKMGRPNWCSVSSVYDLVTLFDALIGNFDRSTDNLWIETSAWRVRLSDHDKTFTTADRIRAYTSPPVVPAELARRLSEMNEETLARELGDLLSRREIKAVLKRRDSILSIWPQA
jgi:hypothetical protein